MLLLLFFVVILTLLKYITPDGSVKKKWLLIKIDFNQEKIINKIAIGHWSVIIGYFVSINMLKKLIETIVIKLSTSSEN